MPRLRISLPLTLSIAILANAQTVAVNPRVEALAAAWKAASSDADRAQLLAKYAPTDRPLFSNLADAGDDLRKKGDFPGARIRFDICTSAAIQTGDDLYSSICLQLEGGLDRLEGKYEEAEAHYKLGLEYSRKPGATVRIPQILNNLASVYGAEARYQDSLEMLQSALDYDKDTGIKLDAAPLQNMGTIYGLLGDLSLSLQYFLKAQAMYEELHNDEKLALVHNNIGVLYSKQANYEAAEREFELALALAEKAGDRTMAGSINGELGRMLGLENKPKEAIAALNLALSMTREIGFKQGYNDVLLDAANFETDRGDFSVAIADFKEALDVSEQLKDAHNQGLALRGLGLIARLQKNFQGALTYAEDAQKRATAIGDREGQWQSEALAGMALRGLGDNAKARDRFTRAISLIEEQRGLIAGGEVEKQLFFEQAVFPYRELAQIEVESGNSLRALQAAERTRARVLLDIIEAGPSPIDRLMSKEDRAEETALRARIAVGNSRPTPAATREGAFHAYEDFLARLYARNPEMRSWRGESPVIEPAELEQLIPDAKTAILEFLSGQDETLLFAVTRDEGKVQIRTFRLPIGRVALTARAGKFHSQIEGRDPGFRAASRELFDLLLKPAAAVIRNRTRVYVVADGPLWELPFQALPGPMGGYWIEHATVSMAPSISFLRDQNAAAHNGATKFSHDLIAFSALPELDDQVRRIAKLYSSARVVLRTSSEARESAFNAEAPDARIIHLAAHGVMDRQNAMHSRILLSGAGGGTEDGRLEAWELMRMNLHADLAVLSACETGRGRVAEGEGLVGLTWALFVAGVKTTVVSQWQVESGSTTELMVQFHRRLRSGLKPADALHGAILALMKDERYRHPMYWSGFVVAGL